MDQNFHTEALPHNKYVVFLPKINQLMLLGETGRSSFWEFAKFIN